MENQVDFKILPSDQFNVYSPATRSDKIITYFTLLSKLRGDILAVSSQEDPNNIVSAYYTNVGNTQTLHLVKGDGSEVTASNSFAGTVTSVDMSVPTGFAISGNPITTSGTLNVSFASGYSLPTDALQATWTTAYNRSITSAAVTGTSTKTLTLNQQDGGTVTASWTDQGLTSVGLTMPAAFNVANSPLTSNGTIAVTAAGLSSQYIRGDGQLANFPSAGGGGSAVNYYLNGSVNQGTFGGTTYYQMSRTPISGAGTNFTRTSAQGDGYVASFITDAGDPDLLNIPGGNWNLEFYFNSSSSGGAPAFYGDLYKVSASNVFTLISSGSTNAEVISGGTTVDQYYTSIAVPQTTLLSTDRLAIRVYVIVDGRNITLHTEDNNFSEVITTFSTGLNALNGLTDQVQYFATGTGGTDFNIVSATDTHTFNIPTASGTNRGLLSSSDWTTFNNKASDSFKTIAVSGQSNVVADSATDTLTFEAGSNIVITTDATNDKITITALGGGSGSVTSVDMSVPTGFAISGNPITTSGTLALAFASGYSLPTNASQTNWNTAYDNSITAFAYNTANGVLTLTQQDAGTLTATVTLAPFTTTNLTEGTNLYFTTARARQSLSAGTGITYNNSTGVITNDAPDQVVAVTAGTGISVTGTYPNFTITNTSPSSGGTVTGSGTTNYLSKWTSASALGDSLVFDNGTNVGIGTTSPLKKLVVTTGNNTNSSSNKSDALAYFGGGNDNPNAQNISFPNPSITDLSIPGMYWWSADVMFGRYKNEAFWSIKETHGGALGSGQLDIIRSYFYDSGGYSYIDKTVIPNGNVGIGTTAPTEKLVVTGAIRSTNQSNNFSTGGVSAFMDIINASKLVRIGSVTGGDTLSGSEGDVGIFTRGNEVVRITAAGNIGIGTTSPNTPLSTSRGIVINSGASNDVQIRMQNNNTGSTGSDGGLLSISNLQMYLWNYENSTLIFGTNNAERMRITADGSLLVGATNPDVGGSVKGTIIREDGSIVAARNIASPFHYQTPISADRMNTMGDGIMYSMWRQGVFQAGIGATNASNMTFFTGDNSSASERMRITSSGALLVGTTSTTNTASGKIVNLTAGSSSPDLSLNGGAWSIASIGAEPALYLSSNIVAATGLPSATQTAKGGIGFEYSNAAAPTDLVLGIFGSPTVSSSVRIFNNTERIRIASTGATRLNAYGSGSFTGTVAYNLAVDSSGNIIETAGGVVDGSGTANYVSKWSDANTLTDSVIYDNGTNVGIGNSNPGSLLQVGNAGASPTGLATLTLTGANTAPQIATKPGLYHRHAVGLGVFSDYAMSFQVNGSSALSDAMYITNTGNVGIGTTNPGGRLHIATPDPATNFVAIDFRNPTYGIYGKSNSISARGNTLEFTATDYNGGSVTTREVLTLRPEGNVGIGTTAPVSALSVVGKTNLGNQASGFYVTPSTLHIASSTVSQISFEDYIITAAIAIANNTFAFGHQNASPSYEFKHSNTYNGNYATTGTTFARFNPTTSYISSGNVLIGTTTDSGYKLNVNGTSYINGAASFGSTIDVNGNVTLTQDTNDLIFQQTNSSTHGIVWKNTSYTKDSASIRPTGNGAWATQGIGFYTGSAGNSTTAPSLRFNIQAGGDSIFYNNVGIGTTSPGNKLAILAPDTAGVPTLGTNQGHFGIFNGTGAGSYGLLGGIINNGNAYLQVQRIDGTATAYNMLLQPSGGNVGINQTSPIMKLHIADVGANIVGGNAISTSTMKGVMIQNTNNGDESVGVWFNTGGNHWSGISGQRTSAATNWATDLRFYTHEAATVDLTYARERVRIDSEGNVGIGTTAPGAKLEVVGNTYLRTQVFTDTIRPYTGNQLQLLNGGSNTLFINGNVGIGTTAPQERLHVETSSEYQITWVRTGAGKRWALGTDTNGTYFTNRTDSVLPVYITNTGNVGIGTTAPVTPLQVVSATNAVDVLRIGNTAGNSGSVQAITHLAINHFNAGTNPSTRITAYQDGLSGWPGGMYFSTRSVNTDSAPVERMRITSGGLVGIGTSFPSHILHITDVMRMDNVSAYSPNLSSTSSPKFGYGDVSNDRYLAEPVIWFKINVDGTEYVIPGYTEVI